MESSLEVFDVGDGLAVGALGPVCIAIWRGAVTTPTFERQRAGLARVVRQAPGDAAFICVVEPGAKPPDDSLRRASATMLADHGTNLGHVGVVIEGSGIKAALTRTVLSGIGMLWSERKASNQYFSSVQEASDWLAGRNAISASQRISAAVEELRTKL